MGDTQKKILMTTRRTWELHDIDTGEDIAEGLPSGTHEMERVPSPRHNCMMLVLKGTRHGAGEASWRQWGDSHDPSFLITFEE